MFIKLPDSLEVLEFAPQIDKLLMKLRTLFVIDLNDNGCVEQKLMKPPAEASLKAPKASRIRRMI